MLTAIAPAPEEASPPTPPTRSSQPAHKWRMYRAVARKELRELAPWILLAAIAELYLLCVVLGVRTPFLRQSAVTIPFVNDSPTYLMFWVAGIFGAIAGLWQTLWESSRGTFQFLLHRPLPRRDLFAVKLCVGTVLTLLACGLPIALYAIWAATPGTHASPFAWSMTALAWGVCVEMPVFYLGAFLSGLRPGRWYGSRFLPLAGAILLFAVALGLAGLFSILLSLTLVWIADICFVVAILYVAETRDYS